MPRMTFTGYTPYPHQRAVHNAMAGCYRSGRIFVVKSKRQVGKTTMAENALLEMAINHAGTLSLLIEPTLDQARRVYKELVRAVEDTPALKRKNDSLLELEFINGSSILFKSAEQRDNLRGFTVTGLLVIDECAFILDEIMDILLPTTDVHRAPILLISTPKLKQGFFWRYWSAGLSGTNPDIISIDFNAFDTSAMLSQERLDQYRKMMPKAQFTSEYLGEFLDTDAILFTNISECIGEPGTGDALYYGIDWGSGAGGDYTSVAAFDSSRHMTSIVYFNDKGTFEQASFIAEILAGNRDKVRAVVAEANSIGAPMIDLLKAELDKRGCRDISNRIQPFNTTNAEKVRLVKQLQVALEQRTVTLVGDPGLVSQLTAYEATYNPKTNNVSYNAPAGLHDDNCISTMLALDALENASRTGVYSLSFSQLNQRRPHGTRKHH